MATYCTQQYPNTECPTPTTEVRTTVPDYVSPPPKVTTTVPPTTTTTTTAQPRIPSTPLAATGTNVIFPALTVAVLVIILGMITMFVVELRSRTGGHYGRK